ncbi:MAG TPA: OmpH family outer membrane protein [Parasulfuritortus sp.]
MRKLLTAVLFGLIVVSPLASADMKIGYINTERLFKESPMAIKAQKHLEQEFSKREQDLQKMIKQARDMQSYLEKEGMTLSDNDRSRKERDLSNLTLQIQQAQREYREDLNQRKQEEFADINQRARTVINDIATKEKFDLILENVVYSSPRIDITDRVLKAMDH